MKYIDAEKLKAEIERLEHENCMNGGEHFCMRRAMCLGKLRNIINPIYHEQQEQPDKESLNESQREFVNIVTERMLKEGPIPTLKGKQKAEFEKEFNRFKQITGMINFPAHMEIIMPT